MLESGTLRLRLCLPLFASLAFILAWSAPAAAYPWMVRHEYTACATCHADPSGAGVLTPYGRAQSAILLSTAYRGTVEVEPGGAQDFLFGVAPMPDWLLLQAWIRNGFMANAVGEPIVDSRALQMVADVGAHISLGPVRASATVGYNSAATAALSDLAWVTTANTLGNVVSREHWLGASFAEDTILVRGGRTNLPFGVRNIEHTSWVRSETRTDVNQGQQHGAAVAYSGERLRGELMLIAGNFQVNPDAFRERGYAAFAELAVTSRLAVGASSLVAHSAADLLTAKETTRQAHGLFVRAGPWKELALLGEVDALIQSPARSSTQTGYVGFAQADVEPVQGLHGILTGEVLSRGQAADPTHFGVWLGVAWFAFPHVDVRGDVIRRSADGAPTTTTYLVQLHVYL